MGARSVFLVCATILAALTAGCCSMCPQKLPKEVIIERAVCPPVKLPERPAIVDCMPIDSDAECAAKRITALVLLDGYSQKLESLLASLATPH